ncbi:MAG: Methylated-DNA--protein-cysteine methyltransferase, constitutive [Pelotomaculum sp. PtaB.Bin104]|nr:MAG: Methylated-DNA--protein-cysteine methyltransferase, constitutive [Pelotomaculum sp. PtaB.Bin104]
MKSIFSYQTALGEIKIAENGTAITNLCFQEDSIPAGAFVQETELLKEASEQLTDYLLGKRKNFSLPLAPEGTIFMLGVWEALCAIPYGETRTYGDVANSIGKKKASRAVGMANNRNPIPVFIPCHRVIGKNGKLVGYRGGLQIKERLLELEKQRGINEDNRL